MPRTADENEAVGFGWVGRWNDGSIGWVLPDHLACHSGETEAPFRRCCVSPDTRLVRCRITIEVLKDKKGRPITRRAKTVGASARKGA